MERTIKAIAQINDTQLGGGFDPNRQSWKIGKSQTYLSLLPLYFLIIDSFSIVKMELQDLTIRINGYLKEVCNNQMILF